MVCRIVYSADMDISGNQKSIRSAKRSPSTALRRLYLERLAVWAAEGQAYGSRVFFGFGFCLAAFRHTGAPAPSMATLESLARRLADLLDESELCGPTWQQRHGSKSVAGQDYDALNRGVSS